MCVCVCVGGGGGGWVDLRPPAPSPMRRYVKAMMSRVVRLEAHRLPLLSGFSS